MLTYVQFNIQISLLTIIKLSNMFPVFNNPKARNVKIVEYDVSFDNFAMSRVQIIEYQWFIRQFSKTQELVIPIQLAVVPKSALNEKNAPLAALHTELRVVRLTYHSRSSGQFPNI